MRRRYRARQLRRLALGPAAAFFARTAVAAALGSRRRAPPGPATATAGAGGGVDPTQAPVGAGGALRPAPLAARAAHSTRLVSTPAVA
jgi:hypothetical protein